MAKPWPRDAYVKAVWASDLSTLPRIVALAYGDHAARTDAAWIALPRLMAVTGIRSKSSALNARNTLERLGWLELVEVGRQHRASRYRITIPEGAQGSVSRTAETEARGTSHDSRGTSHDSRGTGDGPDYSEDCSEDAAAAPAAAVDLEAFLARQSRAVS